MMQPTAQAAGMRHAAAQLRAKAERVSAVMGRLDAQVGAMVYSGPAADQFRAVMAAERDGLTTARSVLGQAADLMDRAAARVESDPLGFDQAWTGGTI